jgi:hypothetical protein
VLHTRGPGFALCFAGLHLLVNLTIAVGAAVGIVQWLGSRSFRRLYERVPA